MLQSNYKSFSDASRLSNGTLSAIMRQSDKFKKVKTACYSEQEKVRLDFINFIDSTDKTFYFWQDAWMGYTKTL